MMDYINRFLTVVPSLHLWDEADKPLCKLIKMHRENIQINTIRNEKGYLTTDTKEIQRILRSYNKNLYYTKSGNTKELDNFLVRYHISKLNQDQVNNLKRRINSKEIEAVIKSLTNCGRIF